MYLFFVVFVLPSLVNKALCVLLFENMYLNVYEAEQV